MAELSVKYEWMEVNPNSAPEQGVWGIGRGKPWHKVFKTWVGVEEI